MVKFYTYEGNKEIGMQEVDGSDDRDKAIFLSRSSVQNARDMGFKAYVSHVIETATGEFIFSDSL